MMFAEIVSAIELAFCLEKTEKLLFPPTFEPLEAHVHCLDALGIIVFNVSPSAVELSVVTGVGPGWG